MAPVLFHCLQWTSSIKSLGFYLWARILAIAGRGVVGREEIFYWKNKSSKQREKYVSLPFPQPHCEYSFVEAAGQGQRSQIHSGGWFQNITHLQKCCWRFCCRWMKRPCASACRRAVGKVRSRSRHAWRAAAALLWEALQRRQSRLTGRWKT